jgi:hypothetical protein
MEIIPKGIVLLVLNFVESYNVNAFLTTIDSNQPGLRKNVLQPKEGGFVWLTDIAERCFMLI